LREPLPHKCDQLTIKIARILRGPTQAIAMRLVVSSATHVLSLVDRPAEHRRPEDKEKALAHERAQLEEAEQYYEEVGLRQAQLVYPRGMIVVTLVIAALAQGSGRSAARTSPIGSCLRLRLAPRAPSSA
jgi:hypothetical protein